MEERVLKIEQRDGAAAIIWMDDHAKPVNTLRRELIEEFDFLLAEIESKPEILVLVFASAKADSFIAGADLGQLQQVKTAAEARALSESLQMMQNRIEQLGTATVAAIHGPCLGGGLELALAFDARVASDDARTRLGLPEVRLGLLPGGGGTQRLPRLVGAEKALNMMLTGRHLGPREALQAGLVDDIVAREILIDAAVQRGSKLRFQGSAKRQCRLNRAGLRNWLFSGNPLGRMVLFEQAAKRARVRSRGNYPAPDKILEVVRIGMEKGKVEGLLAESTAFGDLAVSSQAGQLIRLFFAGNELKQESGVDDPAIEPANFRKIGVLGGGLMGAGIAYSTIDRAGMPVRLKDKDDAGVGRGLAHVARLIDARVEKRAITPLQKAQVLARLTGTTDFSGIANCGLVIEAVYENLELKQQMVRDVEELGPESPIFATNTSAITISDIAAASSTPQKVIGMHYFSPVEKMPLLEVIVTGQTAPWVTATCVELGKKQGKTVIVVNDGPGFYTTRILGPYMAEAARLLAEGVPVERVDNAIVNFGFPVGPLTLLDEVGIDVGLKVAETLHQALGNRMQPVEQMRRLIDNKRLGRKNRKGIYRYEANGKKRGKVVDESIYALLDVEPVNMMLEQNIVERCVLQMINEAAYCLGDGILRSPRDGDVGAVFGLGFPPYLGGPFRYLDAKRCDRVCNKLEALAEKYGERFRPAPLIGEMHKFYR